MNSKITAPFGAWASPITADLITGSTIRLGQICIDGDRIYWTESRPEEGGRNVIMERGPGDSRQEITPADFNVRSRLHEYGGGAFGVFEGIVYFVNFADQRVYRQTPGQAPEPITPEGKFHHGDFAFDKIHNRLICVREDHRQKGSEGSPEEKNEIVAIDLDAKSEISVRVLAEGADFYSNPRIAPSGDKLLWISWNHPNMPWDETELFCATLSEDGLKKPIRLAGGEGESIFQPEWSPEGALLYVSDKTDWYNFYRIGPDKLNSSGSGELVYGKDVEFGRTQWVFGMSTYDFIAPLNLFTVYNEKGIWKAGQLNLLSGKLFPIDLPFTDIGDIKAGPDFVCFNAAGPETPGALYKLDLSDFSLELLRSSADRELDPGYITRPEIIEFPTGTKGQVTAHGFFYPPKNKSYQAPSGDLPPLIVKCHGGPTHATSAALKLDIQYWTSRGFAVLDVNYRGSNGYGKAYRRMLESNWGVADVEDCALGAKFLADRGRVDGERLAITGGSAGGYTVLCALTFRDEFKAGASHYGISNLEALARDTHKFEARYLDRLVAPYPEGKNIYEERSPIHHAQGLSCPVVFFQGLEDRVVPPDQAEAMFEILKQKGVPAAYVPFAGEQHGFRKAENIRRALEGELYFYAKIFGFDPPGLDPALDRVIDIVNLTEDRSQV